MTPGALNVLLELLRVQVGTRDLGVQDSGAATGVWDFRQRNPQ